MPKYDLVDFEGVWLWVRQPDGSYLVDKNHLEEFKKIWDSLNK